MNVQSKFWNLARRKYEAKSGDIRVLEANSRTFGCLLAHHQQSEALHDPDREENAVVAFYQRAIFHFTDIFHAYIANQR